MSKPHSAATSIHMGAYVQTADPGAVGAKKLWVDTSGGEPYMLKVRNAANAAWEDIGATGGGGGGTGIAIGGNAEGADLELGTLDDFDVLIIRNGAPRFSVAATGTNFANKLTADALEIYGLAAVQSLEAVGPIKTDERIYVEGDQVVGHRWVAIPDVASGYATPAAATYTQADIQVIVTLVNELKDQVNEAFAMLRNHGLIEPV